MKDSNTWRVFSLLLLALWVEEKPQQKKASGLEVTKEKVMNYLLKPQKEQSCPHIHLTQWDTFSSNFSIRTVR